MNQRQKNKQLKMRNKKLVKRYPFLAPRNVWSGKLVKDYDYTYTEYDCLLPGWKLAFGDLLLEELRDACIKTNFLDKLMITQWKEKYGSNRIYTMGAPQEVHDVIQKYEFISQYVCWKCGSPDATLIDGGWVLPYCKRCCEKEKGLRGVLWEEMVDPEDVGLPNEYRYTRWAKGEKETITVDISETANKIRKRYERRIKHE